jgi:cytochrome P450
MLGPQKGPLAFFSDLAEEYGDVVFFRIGTRPIYTVYHPEDVGHVLVTEHKKFIKDAVTRELSVVLGQGLLTSDGELWKRQRKLASPSLTKKQIAAYADAMVRHTADASTTWTDGESRNVHADLMRLTLDIVLETLFGSVSGVRANQVAELIEVTMVEFERRMGGWRRLLPAWVPSRGTRRVKKAAAQLDEILLDLIRNRRKAEEGDDLLWRLLVARDDDGAAMTDQQLRDECLTLFLAGHETTALTLSYALHLLSIHGDAAERVAAEVDEVLGTRAAQANDVASLPYCEAVIKESLRLFPPAWSIGREAIEPVEVAGYTLPPGSQVVVPQWVIQRDPRWFEDPSVFRPTRWLDGRADEIPRFAYLPFGGGPRVCIGNHFAMMEAVLVLATIMQRHQVFPVAGFRLELAPSVTLRPKAGVSLRVSRRESFRS